MTFKDRVAVLWPRLKAMPAFWVVVTVFVVCVLFTLASLTQ